MIVGILTVLPVVSRNVFIFLFAGHEVESSRSSSDASVVPQQFFADHSRHIVLLICAVGSVS